MATIIDTKRTRTVNGTDFPITEQVYKFKNIWVCATCCNGTSESVREFKTKKEALEYAQK